MTDSDQTTKAREWWIDHVTLAEVDEAYKDARYDDLIHVIEKSAYLELKAECDSLQRIHSDYERQIHELKAERDAALTLLDEALAALDDIALSQAVMPDYNWNRRARDTAARIRAKLKE